MDYFSTLNSHGFNRLFRGWQTPSAALATGEDESHNSIPVLLFLDHYENMRNEVVQENRYIPIEYVGQIEDEITVEQEDFTQGHVYLGSPVMVV